MPPAKASNPDLGWTIANAQHVRLSDFKKQILILDFYATWCAPCREEHPLLVAVAREQGINLVGLNYKDDPRNAQEWLLKLGDPYLVTAVDRDGRVGIDYGVYGVPETYVIDRNGIIRYKRIGPVTVQILEQKILPLVRQLQG